MDTENPAPAATDPAPVATEQPLPPQSAPRRTVTLPVLPLAIVSAIVVALVFFGGGVALGVTIGDHGHRVGTVQPFSGQNGSGSQNGYGPQNGQNGDGPQNGAGPNRQNGQRGQNGNGQQHPLNRPSGAPQNG